MTDFEKYLRENKENLHKSEETSKDLWSTIEQKLEQKKERKGMLLYKVAAAVSLLVALGLLFKTSLDETEQPVEKLPLYSYSTEYGDMERELQKALVFETEMVNYIEIDTAYVQQLNSFKDGLLELEKAYEVYKNMLLEEQDVEYVTTLIIDNYQQRLELLKALHEELIKINENKNNNETAKTTLTI
jgi:hypothetical protein